MARCVERDICAETEKSRRAETQARLVENFGKSNVHDAIVTMICCAIVEGRLLLMLGIVIKN